MVNFVIGMPDELYGRLCSVAGEERTTGQSKVDPEFRTGGEVRVPLLNWSQLLLSGRSGRCLKALHSRSPRKRLAFDTLRHQSFHRKSPCSQDKVLATSSIGYSRKDGRLHCRRGPDEKGS